MKPRIRLESARSPGGALLELFRHDRDLLLAVDGEVLMSTRLRHSEEALARLTLTDLEPGARVLVGGLGMGYTLRAALDLLPAESRVTVVELVPEIAGWHEGPLGEAAERPLLDPRVTLEIGDVADVLRRHRGRFDAVLLDVDNGPSPLVSEGNAGLYSPTGLREARAALRKGGRLGVWSADDDSAFARRMQRSGFRVTVHPTPGRSARSGPKNVLFLGRT